MYHNYVCIIYIYIPALSDTFSTDPCISFDGGISFHVAKNTLRSEGERETEDISDQNTFIVAMTIRTLH